MTGKEFLWQYIMIDRQIRSVKLQLDSMTEVAKENAMSSVFQNEITGLKNELKNLILESAAVSVRLSKFDRQNRCQLTHNEAFQGNFGFRKLQD